MGPGQGGQAMQRGRLVMPTRIGMVVVILVAPGLTGRAAVGRAMPCVEYARFLNESNPTAK
jgi:hypothetical protein